MTSSDTAAAVDEIEIDTLIAGGGMAGLYTAWRLADSGRDVCIVEKLDRIGGRLQTDHMVIDGKQVEAEEGGMRMMKTQIELHALLDQLGLSDQLTNFPMGTKANTFYVRGRRFTAGEAFADPGIWSEIYNLDEKSKGKQPGDILMEIRNVILVENNKDPKTWQSNPETWTEFRLKYTYKGIETYKWGFWALLEDYGLSTDCIKMLYDSSGFIAPFDQKVNAGCAFQLLADFVHPNFFALKGGYSTLPETLKAQLDEQSVPIHLGHQVTRIERNQDGKLEVWADHDGKMVKFVCREVVLALTQIALRQLAYFAPELRDNVQFMSDIETVTDMALGKVNLFYDKNWWTPALDVRTGACFTDMPLAQVYFFEEPGHRQPGTIDDVGPGHITIYTDYYRVNFWSELQAMGKPYHTHEFPENIPHTTAASTEVVRVITKQMKQMFNLEDIPAPVSTTYKAWIEPEMGDGDHQWRIDVDDTLVRARLTNPSPSFYVCGESYSDDQAWVNGALRSVDEMLDAHFNLPPLRQTV